jgi:hypothetical protein
MTDRDSDMSLSAGMSSMTIKWGALMSLVIAIVSGAAYIGGNIHRIDTLENRQNDVLIRLRQAELEASRNGQRIIQLEKELDRLP